MKLKKFNFIEKKKILKFSLSNKPGIAVERISAHTPNKVKSVWENLYYLKYMEYKEIENFVYKFLNHIKRKLFN